jgi:hypothetical protein
MKDLLANRLRRDRNLKDSELLRFLLNYLRLGASVDRLGGTTYGTVFEIFAIRRLASGGNFRIKRLLDTDVAGVVTNASRTGETPNGILDGWFERPPSRPRYCASIDDIAAELAVQCSLSLASVIAPAAPAAAVQVSFTARLDSEVPAPQAVPRAVHSQPATGSDAASVPVLLVPDTKALSFVDVFIPAPPAFRPYKVLLTIVATGSRYSGTIKMMTGRTQNCTTAEFAGGLDAVMSTLQLRNVTDACILWLMPPAAFADAHQAMPLELPQLVDWHSESAGRPCYNRVAQYAVCVDFSIDDLHRAYELERKALAKAQ